VKKILKSLGPIVLTLVAVVIAAIVLKHLWHYYRDEPWTRDGHLRADVVQVAPDVSGLVTAVEVADNQPVHRGQALFVIDRSRYELALEQALVAVEKATASLHQFQREALRNHTLSDLISKEIVEEGRSKVEVAQAALDEAKNAVDLARLNLQRTTVCSPVDGFVNDRTVRVGDYVNTGHPVLSVVDRHSFHVDGYFEETKLSRIHIGQPVKIEVMGESQLLHGHVQSIAAGIEDRDRAPGSNLLPDINPTFNWVRLAQRVPVRIKLDGDPGDIRLIVGRTATVTVLRDNDASARPRQPAAPAATPARPSLAPATAGSTP
jgi:multidrug resistance efflux pump